MRILFFDTETSGLPDYRSGPSSQQPHIVQLGADLYDTEKYETPAEPSEPEASEGPFRNYSGIDLAGIGGKNADTHSSSSVSAEGGARTVSAAGGPGGWSTTTTRYPDASLNLTFRCPVPIPPEAIRVHGITNRRADRVGIAPRDGLEVFKSLVEKCDLIVAHNLRFDSLMFESACIRYGVDLGAFLHRRHYCTMKEAQVICQLPGVRGGYKWPTLSEACAHYNIHFDHTLAHSAMYDVRKCAEIFWKLYTQRIATP